ncbi:MAG: hypothetical protein LBV78_11380 [Kitasatospora sp.]|nr:hypothetical protein [Kitasatospora sp.]
MSGPDRPDRPERSTAVSSATAPPTRQLRDSAGAQLTSSTTTVHGADRSTHLVNWSARSPASEPHPAPQRDPVPRPTRLR